MQESGQNSRATTRGNEAAPENGGARWGSRRSERHCKPDLWLRTGGMVATRGVMASGEWLHSKPGRNGKFGEKLCHTHFIPGSSYTTGLNRRMTVLRQT
jgi:hypothetical protein